MLDWDLRRVLGSQTFATMLPSCRANLMRQIRDDMNGETPGLGVEVAAVHIRHADLPPQNSDAIFRRMKQERMREAAEFRAEGEEISCRIRARSDRDVTVLLAEANRQSQILRGEGEAEKTKILSDAARIACEALISSLRSACRNSSLRCNTQRVSLRNHISVSTI